MSLKSCVLKHRDRLTQPEKEDLKHAVEVHMAQGMERQQAEEQAILDKLEELQGVRDNVVSAIVTEFKAKMPGKYAKAESVVSKMESATENALSTPENLDELGKNLDKNPDPIQEQQAKESAAAGSRVKLIKNSHNNDVDFDATEKALPNIADGMTRLFRASSPTVKFDDVFDAEKLTEFKPPKGLTGEFYTESLPYADYFRVSLGRNAFINYIDVPTGYLDGRKLPADGAYIVDLSDPLSRADPKRQAKESSASDDGVRLNEKPVGDVSAPENLTTKGTKLADKATETITDFGEKLEGAKKDTRSLREKLSDKNVDTAAVPLSQSFPQPDYEKLAAAGVPHEVLAFVAMLRGEIKTKPKRNVRGWADTVNAMRSYANNLLDGSLSIAEAVKEFRVRGPYAKNIPDVIAIAKEILPSQIKDLGSYRLEHRHYSIYRGKENVFKWTVINTAQKGGAFRSDGAETNFDTKEEALAFIKSQVSTSDDAGKPLAKFDVWSIRGEPGYWVGKKLGTNKYVELKKFDSSREARDFIVSHNDELTELLKQKKHIGAERRAEQNERVGKDYRRGVNVTQDLFDETFGFRGVQFGTYVNNDKRQQDLNNAYDGLLDLAEVLGIPPKAISLNGELGLAFGARGNGGKDAASAHYESGEVVINLTKANGAGSLAHEWWHALDNYFAKRGELKSKSGEFITELNRPQHKEIMRDGRRTIVEADPKDFGVRPEVYDAFKALVRTIKKDTQLYARSAVLDGRKTADYWTTTRELTARAFERYVIDELKAKGYESDYLASILPKGAWDASEARFGNTKESYPYPTDEEAVKINAAYSALFDAIETKETDRGVVLYSLGDNKEAPEFLEDEAQAKNLSTGSPVRFNFIHNTESATDVFGKPNKSSKFGRAYEPSARYVSIVSKAMADNAVRNNKNYIAGVLTFNNPLVIPANGVGWKKELSQKYGGKTGKKLSIALINDGYDGVITTDGEYTSEVIDLTTFDESKARYRLGESDTGAISHDEVTATLVRVRAGFDKGAELPVLPLASFADFPAAIQADAKERGIDTSKIKGVFHKGKILVNLDAIGTQQELESVILHELAHDGLAKMFGPEITSAMSKLYFAIGGTKALNELAAKHAMPVNKYGEAYKDSSPQQRTAVMMEELLAHIAQDSRPNVKRRLAELVGAIRQWLRAHGFLASSKVSESELFAILREARKASVNGVGDMRYSLAADENKYVLVDGKQRPTTNSSGQPIHPTEEGVRNFWKWFGDSKVVDEQGRPLVVYHGTDAQFYTFDRSKAGNGPSKFGFWFADDQGFTEMFGSSPVASYLEAGSLKEITKGQWDTIRGKHARDGEWFANWGKELSSHGFNGLRVKGGTELLGRHKVRNPDIYAVFNPDQIKSATGNNGDFDPANSDIRYSLDGEDSAASGAQGASGLRGLYDKAADLFKTDARKQREAEAASLDPSTREAYARLGDKDKGIIQKIKTEIKRQLTPAGLLPQDIFNLKIERDGHINSDEFLAGARLSGLYAAVKKEFGRPYDQLQPRTKALLDRALKGEDMRLPPAVKHELTLMRDQVKRLSATHLEQLIADAERLSSEGKDQEASAKLALAETIADNMETYLHRSYRAFDDKDWPTKVPPKVFDAAVKYLAQGYAGDGQVTADHIAAARKKATLMLEEGTAFDTMGAFISESKLGAKDLSIIKKRKDIAPEIRALLGEYEDPTINFAKTVTKMGRLVYNHAFLNRVREIGFEQGFFSEAEDLNIHTNKQIAGDASEVYAPLNGLYTTKEFHQAMVDAMGREQMQNWYRLIIQANGMVKFGKTVLSPTTALRNLYSAMFFSLANGHFNFGKGKNFSFNSYFRRQGDGVEYMAKLRRLGVVYDAIYAAEMMDLLKDSRLEDTIFASKPMRWTKASLDYAQKFYSFGDDLWKIIGFENEKAMLMKNAGMSEAAAEKEAAERIRNTYPTYSMTPRAVNTLRRFPLVGTFVSFPAEIIRTSYHITRYLAHDIKTQGLSSPMVWRKLIGWMIAAGAMYGLQAITRSLCGVSDDEEDALRLLSPQWQKNSNLMFLGRDDKGALQTMDMSFLDPYGYWKRPINALLQGQPLGKALKSGAHDVLVPFFGQDIAFGAIMDVAMNKKDTGGPVFNPEDSAGSQTLDISLHLAKAIQPGIASNIGRMYLASQGRVSASGRKFSMTDEAAALAGFRWGTFEPRTALYYQSFGFVDRKRNAAKVLSSVVRDPNEVSDDDLQDAFEQSMKSRDAAYSDMIKIAAAAKAGGLSVLEVQRTLTDSGIGRDDARDIARGKIPKWEHSKGGSKGAIKKAALLFGRDTADEIKRRDKFIAKLKAGGAEVDY